MIILLIEIQIKASRMLLTLNNGFKIEEPAFPNSNALINNGRILYRDKLDGKLSSNVGRLLKKRAFSFASFI